MVKRLLTLDVTHADLLVTIILDLLRFTIFVIYGAQRSVDLLFEKDRSLKRFISILSQFFVIFSCIHFQSGLYFPPVHLPEYVSPDNFVVVNI